MILTQEAKDSMGATGTQVRLSRNFGNPKIEDVVLLRLGDEQSAPWIHPAVNIEPSNIKTIARSTVRVIAPLDYRQHFLDSDKDQPRHVVSAVAQSSDKVKATNLIGKWSHTQYHHQDLLTGWLSLPTEQASAIAAQSGRHGIFAQMQENTVGSKKIIWFQRQSDENAESYLQKCLQNAKGRTGGLFFSKSSTPHNIGMEMTQEEKAKGQEANYLLRGAPGEWQTEELEDFLQQQKWQNVKRISKVRFRNEWRFHAQPPTANQESFHYQLAEKYISCIPVPVKQRQPSWQQPVRNTWRGTDETTHTSVAARKPEIPVTPTQIDAGGSQESSRARERSRSPDMGKKATVTGSKSEHSSSDLEECLQAGWQIQDLGGTGDCLYRSIAASLHWHKHGKLMSKDASELEAAELRAKTVQHARKHNIRLSSWFAPGPEETPGERGGASQAKTIQEWCDQQMKKEVWADGLSIHCLAEACGLIIIVFKAHEPGQWERYAFAPGWSKEMAKCKRNSQPVILTLKKKHFEAVHAPAKNQGPSTLVAQNAATPDH